MRGLKSGIAYESSGTNKYPTMDSSFHCLPEQAADHCCLANKSVKIVLSGLKYTVTTRFIFISRLYLQTPCLLHGSSLK